MKSQEVIWSLLYTVRIWLLLCCTSIHVQWIFRHGEVSVWGCVCMYVCMSILWLKYISCFIYIPSHHMYFYIVRQIQWQTRVIVNLLYDRDTTAGQQNTSMLATEWHTTHCRGWQWPTSFPVLHHSYHHLWYSSPSALLSLWPYPCIRIACARLTPCMYIRTLYFTILVSTASVIV